MAKWLLHALGYPQFGGQPQDHYKNECDSGQPGYQVQFETDGASLQA